MLRTPQMSSVLGSAEAETLLLRAPAPTNTGPVSVEYVGLKYSETNPECSKKLYALTIPSF